MPPTHFDVGIAASLALELPPEFGTSPRALAVNVCHRSAPRQPLSRRELAGRSMRQPHSGCGRSARYCRLSGGLVDRRRRITRPGWAQLQVHEATRLRGTARAGGVPRGGWAGVPCPVSRALGLGEELTVLQDETSLVAATLTYVDMTTSTDGEGLTLSGRLDLMDSQHGCAARAGHRPSSSRPAADPRGQLGGGHAAPGWTAGTEVRVVPPPAAPASKLTELGPAADEVAGLAQLALDHDRASTSSRSPTRRRFQRPCRGRSRTRHETASTQLSRDYDSRFSVSRVARTGEESSANCGAGPCTRLDREPSETHSGSVQSPGPNVGRRDRHQGDGLFAHGLGR